jgi:hypothetical protein
MRRGPSGRAALFCGAEILKIEALLTIWRMDHCTLHWHYWPSTKNKFLGRKHDAE